MLAVMNVIFQKWNWAISETCSDSIARQVSARHCFSVPWSGGSDVCLRCLLQVTLIDLIVYGSLEAFHVHSVRWTRALRPVFLINFPESRQVRR